MSRFLLVGLLWCACAPKAPKDDLPLPENDTPYDGPASSTLPAYNGGSFTEPTFDGGVVVVDPTCCVTQFSISSVEPADAMGELVGEAPVFHAHTPLVRTDAGWSASACVPVGTASRYWYAFSWDGGVVDAGLGELQDGGFGPVSFVQRESSVRHSDREPSIATTSGERVNFYSEVSSCDGGVP